MFCFPSRFFMVLSTSWLNIQLLLVFFTWLHCVRDAAIIFLMTGPLREKITFLEVSTTIKLGGEGGGVKALMTR